MANFDFEKDVIVIETKGLLQEIKEDICDIRFDLTPDNLSKIPERFVRIRKLLDAVEEKVKKNSMIDKNNE